MEMGKITRRLMIRTTGLAAGATAMVRGAMGKPLSGMARVTGGYRMNALPEAAAGGRAGTSTAGATGIPDWGLGPFVRDDGADHLGSRPESVFLCPVTGKLIAWENNSLYTQAAVVKDGKVFLMYRARDRSHGDGLGTSRIGLAVSDDGRHFTRHPVPVLYPNNDFMKEYEWPGGCEDPRIAQAEDGTYVMTYTGWDGDIPRLCSATSKDLYKWTKHGLAIGTCHKGKYRNFGSKSGAIVCRQEGSRFIAQRIDGKYWMYFNDAGLIVATSDDLTDWDVIEDAGGKPLIVLPMRPGMFDSTVVESGPPAFLTDKGILVLYNGGANKRPDIGLTSDVWAVSQALFDPKNPTKLIDRMDHDFFHPERDFEKHHQGSSTDGGYNNVTFVSNLVCFHGEWRFYYDAADSIVASAVYRPRQQMKD
jgi:predicted GH43/DUF377 family glycosyl hydrolase